MIQRLFVHFSFGRTGSVRAVRFRSNGPRRFRIYRRDRLLALCDHWMLIQWFSIIIMSVFFEATGAFRGKLDWDPMLPISLALRASF